MNTATGSSKKSTNISLEPVLMAEARKLNINLSATLNSALESVVREQRQARWREDNKAAIAAMNPFTSDHGIPESCEGLRVFE